MAIFESSVARYEYRIFDTIAIVNIRSLYFHDNNHKRLPPMERILPIGLMLIIPSLQTVSAQEMQQRPLASNRLLEEVMVTAQKREESSRDVPIAINAFSSETLDARGISDPLDLPQATPGLTINEQAGYSVTYLRGVGSDAYLLADPSVATYIDGVYYPFAHGAAQTFGSVDRIEILKGPQGTLFGRNSVGGAIHLITSDPSLEEVYGSLDASISHYDSIESKFHLNIPFTDTIAVGLSGVYNESDDYRDGTVAGKPLPGSRTKGGRLKLRWAPVDSFDITLAAFTLSEKGIGSMYATNGDVSPSFENSGTIEEQPRNGGAVDADAYFQLENDVYYGTANFYYDWFDIKIIGSQQKVHTAAKYDFDGSPSPMVSFEIKRQGADVQTGEIQILSNEDSWLSDKLNWIAGYYYFNSIAGMDEIYFGVSESLLGNNGPLSALNDALNPAFNALTGSSLTLSEPIFAYGLLATDSESLFAQGTWQFNHWLGLTLGLRAQEETRTLIASGGKLKTPTGPASYTEYGGQSDTTKSISPKVSIQITPWEKGMIYFSFQEAVKSSTYNVVNFLTFEQPEPVEKEELTAFEIGFKKSLLDSQVSLSAAAFYYDMTNIQVQFLSLFAGGAVTFENAPTAEIAGIDFDLTAIPFPRRIPGLVITAGGAYLESEFTDFREGQGFDEESGLYTDSKDMTGNQIPRTPTFTGAIGALQTFTVENGSIEFAIEYYYNSGYYYLAENSDFSEEKAYDVVGARVSYLYDPWMLRVTAFGKNIFNEEYNYSKFTNDFGALEATAPPAMFGIRAHWDF